MRALSINRRPIRTVSQWTVDQFRSSSPLSLRRSLSAEVVNPLVLLARRRPVIYRKLVVPTAASVRRSTPALARITRQPPRLRPMMSRLSQKPADADIGLSWARPSLSRLGSRKTQHPGADRHPLARGWCFVRLRLLFLPGMMTSRIDCRLT